VSTSPANTISTESAALTATLNDVPPDAPTACSRWRVHEIVAHLAAGAKELADLIESRLSGKGERTTRGFEEREAPFRSLDHDTLLDRLAHEGRRKVLAYEALAVSADPSIAFTGTRITRDKGEVHSRSEAALHRWDITGDDDTSLALLSQPELTGHAVWVLNNMPILNESARAVGARAGVSAPTEVVFRTEGQPDIVLTLDPTGSHFHILAAANDPDLVLTVRADHRPLLLWGRRPAALAPAIEGDRRLLPMLGRALWPDAIPWPWRSGT
jgi:uncharacterized protein (TIGR03083 family)